MGLGAVMEGRILSLHTLKRESVVFEQLMEDEESVEPVSPHPYTEPAPKPEASSGLYAAVV